MACIPTNLPVTLESANSPVMVAVPSTTTSSVPQPDPTISSTQQPPCPSPPPRAILLKGPSTNSKTYFTALPGSLHELIEKAKEYFPVPPDTTPHITLGTDERAILLQDSLPFVRDRELLVFRWAPNTPKRQLGMRVRWDQTLDDPTPSERISSAQTPSHPSSSSHHHHQLQLSSQNLLLPNPSSSSQRPPNRPWSNPTARDPSSKFGTGAAARAAHAQRVLQRQRKMREAELRAEMMESTEMRSKIHQQPQMELEGEEEEGEVLLGGASKRFKADLALPPPPTVQSPVRNKTMSLSTSAAPPDTPPSSSGSSPPPYHSEEKSNEAGNHQDLMDDESGLLNRKKKKNPYGARRQEDQSSSPLQSPTREINAAIVRAHVPPPAFLVGGGGRLGESLIASRRSEEGGEEARKEEKKNTLSSNRSEDDDERSQPISKLDLADLPTVKGGSDRDGSAVPTDGREDSRQVRVASEEEEVREDLASKKGSVEGNQSWSSLGDQDADQVDPRERMEGGDQGGVVVDAGETETTREKEDQDRQTTERDAKLAKTYGAMSAVVESLKSHPGNKVFRDSMSEEFLRFSSNLSRAVDFQIILEKIRSRSYSSPPVSSWYANGVVEEEGEGSVEEGRRKAFSLFKEDLELFWFNAKRFYGAGSAEALCADSIKRFSSIVLDEWERKGLDSGWNESSGFNLSKVGGARNGGDKGENPKSKIRSNVTPSSSSFSSSLGKGSPSNRVEKRLKMMTTTTLPSSPQDLHEIHSNPRSNRISFGTTNLGFQRFVESTRKATSHGGPSSQPSSSARKWNGAKLGGLKRSGGLAFGVERSPDVVGGGDPTLKKSRKDERDSGFEAFQRAILGEDPVQVESDPSNLDREEVVEVDPKADQVCSEMGGNKEEVGDGGQEEELDVVEVGECQVRVGDEEPSSSAPRGMEEEVVEDRQDPTRIQHEDSNHRNNEENVSDSSSKEVERLLLGLDDDEEEQDLDQGFERADEGDGGDHFLTRAREEEKEKERRLDMVEDSQQESQKEVEPTGVEERKEGMDQSSPDLTPEPEEEEGKVKRRGGPTKGGRSKTQPRIEEEEEEEGQGFEILTSSSPVTRRRRKLGMSHVSIPILTTVASESGGKGEVGRRGGGGGGRKRVGGRFVRQDQDQEEEKEVEDEVEVEGEEEEVESGKGGKRGKGNVTKTGKGKRGNVNDARVRKNLDRKVKVVKGNRKNGKKGGGGGGGSTGSRG
ncbi:hypothetical protein IE53DRAFT_390507 [Violaceomyces palustris]|uniref:Uncharacterized protein n=1 Tax=Violaceomyces palustris TaxID=1673888 RepID=A0ACD0NNM0_9BASI|nr:hypothetical protein IE53DRAFT_390507 [Violaceomyces palustris]